VSGPPLNIVAIRDDDALIEALRAGLQPEDRDTLAGRLAAWRDDVQRSTRLDHAALGRAREALRPAVPLGVG
jgi:hypothetical protein